MEQGQLTPLQNAVYLLKQAQAKLDAYEQARSEPIAIIGMGCRFPGGAEDPAAYWRMLCGGVDAITEVPKSRWNVDEFYDSDTSAPVKLNTRWGGFLEHVEDFDADFFGISPREAVRVDPQHRLLMEVAWETLESAGILPADIAQSRTGVYVGAIGNDYALRQMSQIEDIDVFSGTGCSHAILANRLSYWLNLRGPSVALDTACSSSLVTIHLACQSLRRRECELALAGGVNLILGPEMTIVLTKAQMMSPDGRCRAFDASANGYVRSEGCGMVALKRLSDAQADGNAILAVIRGSAVNHDGRSNGLSAPNAPAQEAVIRAALDDAQVTAEQIGYVETHGTGTKLGDPIEIDALRAAIAGSQERTEPLLIGSVKTNIGHCESAAGIAGLIKAALMVKLGKVPPHLHLSNVNPLLHLDDGSFEIPDSLGDWNDEMRLAGVSSFGFGGTNAHIIVGQPPEVERTNRPDRPLHVLSLSARSNEALRQLAKKHFDALDNIADDKQTLKPFDGLDDQASDYSLANWAFTSNAGRTHFAHRAAVIADSFETLRTRLSELKENARPTDASGSADDQAQDPKVAFLFTGQGAQYPEMGRVLYESQPTFRAAIDECGEYLNPSLDRPLDELLEKNSGPLLDQTGFTQPVMFALEYALASLWQSWGVQPTAVLGHSVGEFAAACIAGVFNLEDGLMLIAERARLMQQLPSGGRMAAVFAEPKQVEELLADCKNAISIAAYNGPQSIVVSGDEQAIEELLTRLTQRGIRSKILSTSHAFHSHHMSPMLADLEQVAAKIEYHAPRIDIISNLTGERASRETFADASYWGRHARNPVRFTQGLTAISRLNCNVFLEIGPNPTLIGMGARCLPEKDQHWLPSLRQGRDDWQTMLSTLGQLYSLGVDVDWRAFDQDYARHHLQAPTYPFQRKRFFSGAVLAKLVRDGHPTNEAGIAKHPLLGSQVKTPLSSQIFEQTLSASRPDLLSHHKVHGKVVLPSAAYLEMVLAAAKQLEGKVRLEEIQLPEPLVLASPTNVQTILTPAHQQQSEFQIVSFANQDENEPTVFVTHARGQIHTSADALEHNDGSFQPSVLQERFDDRVADHQWFVHAARKSGLEYGSAFRWIQAHWVNANSALGQLRDVSADEAKENYEFPLGYLESGFQLLGATMPGAGTGMHSFWPERIERLAVHRAPVGKTWCYTLQTDLDERKAVGDVCFVDESGELLVELRGVCLRRVPRDWLLRKVAGPQPDWFYELAWQATPASEPNEPEFASGVQRWLILDCQQRLGSQLSSRLSEAGCDCQVLEGNTDRKTLELAITNFAQRSQEAFGVLHLGNLDAKGICPDPSDFDIARSSGWGGVVDAVQLLAANHSQSAQLFLATRGAVAVTEEIGPISMAQSPTWGLGRVIAAEHPELKCKRIDLDPVAEEQSIDSLLSELMLDDQEDQVAYRDGRRFVPRLQPLPQLNSQNLNVPQEVTSRLEITKQGELENLVIRQVQRVAPGAGQVEIKVRASGLNFRDVLNALGRYPGEAGPLGGECSGEIVAVGDDVSDFKIGDEVIALAPGCFSNFVTTLSSFVTTKPPNLSFEEAATLPVAILTAHYALCEVGALRAGQRVLIHSASGGVGLAAIQVAQQIGAEIYATAGSPQKRQFLSSLGIEHVMNSRSLEFADQLMELTDGEGVDLVLNSLTGEAIEKGISVLRSGGKFIELGKTDLWDQNRVREFKEGVKFHAIALDQLMWDEPQLIRGLLDELIEKFAIGEFTPPRHSVFELAQSEEAMRTMARGQHLGKIVITPAAEGGELNAAPIRLEPAATYLVTGGLGGLGLTLAQWLVDRGARHVILVGRSEPSEEAQAKLEDLRQTGASVLSRRCDISQLTEVDALVTELSHDCPPLRGVFHLAGVLDDGVLREQTRERFDRVMAAKVMGAWHLHQLTKASDLDFFVLFSSVASLMGSPGQANYASANAFLDALAHERRRQNLAALSINWGSWSDVGMASKLEQSEGRRWASAGVGWIDPILGMEAMEEIISSGVTQAAIMPIDWPQFLQRIPAGAEPRWLSTVAAEARQSNSDEDTGPPELVDKLREVAESEQRSVVSDFVAQTAMRILAWDASEPPAVTRPLSELGFDSLTAVEFCNALGRGVGQHINPTLLFDYSTLHQLSGYIADEILGLKPTEIESEAEAESHQDLDEVAHSVEQMSEEEMDALVAKQLGDLENS